MTKQEIIIEIVELGQPKSLIQRKNAPITELIKTDMLIEELNEQLRLYNVSNRYSIEDIEKCVENWGLCKVEKEYIEQFLNGG